MRCLLWELQNNRDLSAKAVSPDSMHIGRGPRTDAVVALSATDHRSPCSTARPSRCLAARPSRWSAAAQPCRRRPPCIASGFARTSPASARSAAAAGRRRLPPCTDADSGLTDADSGPPMRGARRRKA